MSEDKVTYGKPNCRHENTTPIINLPGMSRCDECGEVMRRPKLTRYEWEVLRMGKGKIHPLMDGVTQPTMNACFTGTIAEFREFLEGMRQICAMIQK